ncbi:radical SAM protein [Serratia sp. 1D1416]|uniref:radical SAM protein n=1 Tax=Serratia sp. 1D1416 TaxID=2447890 RepID=UPI001013C7C0|nr:radical SAM protein [Serratia sp. 1D1416]
MLLGTKFNTLADNTVDYWMKPNSNLSYSDIDEKMATLRWSEKSTLQLYVHIPFCTQKCSFCAFSGGNSLEFNEVERYVANLKKHLDFVLDKTKVKEREIDSIHIGGGSPDILGGNARSLLDYLTSLPGFTERTELSIEISLFSVRNEFITQLSRYPITKISFGVQSLNPRIRQYLKMPAKLRKLDEICARLRKTIPVINVDLMTGFPTQTLDDVFYDLEYFINHPHVNSISTYLFSKGSAPAFIADVISGKIPTSPTDIYHANLRFHSYLTLQSYGWKRFGTNTYLDTSDIDPDILSIIKGNECLGAHSYDDFLIGVGASAVSYFPGLRIENKSSLTEWMADIKSGILPYDLKKCSIEKQKDMALWGLPLNFRGIHKDELKKLINNGILDNNQVATFEDYIRQGLIKLNADDVYNLTVLGEVFQGKMVKELKKKKDQQVLTNYIDEGHELALLVSEGRIMDINTLNNRQKGIRDKLTKI